MPRLTSVSAVICCFVVFLSGSATAGIFDTHSRLAVSGSGYVVNTPWGDSFTQDYAGGAFTRIDRVFVDPYSGGAGPYASSSYAGAFTNPLLSDFMGAGASANVGYSGASAYAGWRDVAFPSFGGGPGTFIQLSFTVKAELGGLVGSRSSIEIVGGTYVGDEVWYDGNQSLGVVQFTDAGVWDPDTLTVLPNPVVDVVGPWDHYTFINGEFIGTTHLEVPFDENYGGYSWQLGIRAQSGAQYSSGFATSLHSVGLTSITDVDGNVLSGVTFDSGLIAVPEPSTTGALGVCMISLILTRLRSKRKIGT